MEVEDSARLQMLFDSTSDYEQAFGDRGAADAVGTFINLPEGYDESAKLLLGGWQEGEFVAACDAIVGFPTSTAWTVGLLLVETSHRRQGIGSAIVQWLEQEAAARGATTIRLVVRSTNHGGLAFAERLGYLPDPPTNRDDLIVLSRATACA